MGSFPSVLSFNGSPLHQGLKCSAFDNDGQHISILQLVVQADPLVVEFSTGSTNSCKSEFPHEITVKFDANVLKPLNRP